MKHTLIKHTLVALVQDRPGVLNRAVNVFRRRGLNIESLTVSRTERDGVSRITCVTETDDVMPVLNQLEKLIDVLDAHEVRSFGSPPAVAMSAGEVLLSRGEDAPRSMFAISQADGIA